ncbi:MAG: NAD-dependent epimerase/dehydratase family protein [Pseudomonadota bacterium]
MPSLLITGATGFIGRYLVDQAIVEGWNVLALVRPASSIPVHWQAYEALKVVRGDLRSLGPWVENLRDVDSVVHLAAATSGDLAERVATSILATENLLQSLDLSRVKSFVHVSSFAVYDYSDHASGSRISCQSALEKTPWRDEYTATKVFQEQLARSFSTQHSLPMAIARPGFVYGPEHDWNGGAALQIGKSIRLVFAPRAAFPVSFVKNTARSLLKLISLAAVPATTFNVFDSPVVSYWGFASAAAKVSPTRTLIVPVPWFLIVSLGFAAKAVSYVFFSGKAKLPEVLDERRRNARWRNFRYVENSSFTDAEYCDFDEGIRQTFAKH